tara:strand:+ start:734 stop:997 length:264 start_codon:yes stop_codon:yes gene_type:complete
MVIISGEIFNVFLIYFKKDNYQATYVNIKLRDENQIVHKIALGKLEGFTLPLLIFGSTIKVEIDENIDSKGMSIFDKMFSCEPSSQQ